VQEKGKFMPAPTSAQELIDLAKKSGVVEEKRLEAILGKLRAGNAFPSEPGKLAGILVRDGVLTHFQAEQFLQGRWRRFTIGKYKVMEKLGSGGMGNVYLCEHKFMRRRAAVKVLPAAKAEDPSSLERFYREARAVAALDHPNIVRAYDIDQDDKLHFLVMEYVDGASFQEIIKKFGPMDITRAAHYIRQAAIGLHHAHVAGLVHRDIKPGNVLVDRTGIVKVLDMGLARFFHDEEDVLTKKYDESVLGTADYLAPEQALDSHGVDIRADIYSLGATFYFILTGSTPFSEGTVAQKLIWHQTRQPKSLVLLRPEVPAELAAVVEKMMAKEPTQRYQTPSEVVEALAPWTQQPIPPPPEKEMPRLSPAAMGSMSEISIGSGLHGLSAATSRPPAGTPSPAPTRPPTPPGVPKPPSTLAPPSSTPPRAQGRSTSPATKTVSSISEPASKNEGVAVAASPREENGGVPWDKLTNDTDNPLARTDTIVYGPRSRVSQAEGIRRHPYFWYFVAAGVFALIVLLGALWAMYHGTSESRKGSSSRSTPKTLYVTGKKGKADDFLTIKDALVRARPGDRIVVQKDVHEEHLQVEEGRYGKDVILEGQGPNGGRTLWRLPKNSKEKALLELHNIEGLVVKGFAFDGENRLDDLVVLFGECPGLTLEGIECQGFKHSAVNILHCTGTADRPVAITALRATTANKTEAALLFNHRESITKPLGNDHIRVADCIFVGPFSAAVELIGPERNLEFRSNRFFGAENGFLYKPSKAANPLQMTIASNTLCKLQTGLALESLPQLINSIQNSRVSLDKNLFAQTPIIARVVASPEEQAKSGETVQTLTRQLIQSSGNVRDPSSQEGNVIINAFAVVFPPLPQDTNELQRFLRYPKASPLTQHGSPGVPPVE
jgi:serine/threonine protein kinase